MGWDGGHCRNVWKGEHRGQEEPKTQVQETSAQQSGCSVGTVLRYPCSLPVVWLAWVVVRGWVAPCLYAEHCFFVLFHLCDSENREQKRCLLQLSALLSCVLLHWLAWAAGPRLPGPCTLKSIVCVAKHLCFFLG